MPAAVNFPLSPTFDGTMSSTSTEGNPELGRKLQCAIAEAFRKDHPSVSTVAIKLISTTDGAPATSDRNVYNHFGFVDFNATGITRSGAKVAFSGSISVDSGDIMAA